MFSIALRVHLVKDATISSSKAPKSHVKLVIYMNHYNGFDLLVAVVFSVSPQLGMLWPKAQDLVISFRHGEGETLPQFHLRALQIRSEIFLFQDKTGQINNLTGKYIIKLSKWKHLQRYMTPFELYYRNYERQPQIQQLSITFTPTI